MKKIIAANILVFILMFCSCANKDSSKIKGADIVQEINSENIKTINDIFNDTKEQVPYIDNSFYEFDDDYLKNIDLSKKEYDDIIGQINKVDTINYIIKVDDIQFYDTLANTIKKSIILKSKEDGYNKEILQISRPYNLSQNKIVVFYYGTFLYFRDNQEGPAVGGIWAIKYKKMNGKWTIDKYYSIADIS